MSPFDAPSGTWFPLFWSPSPSLLEVRRVLYAELLRSLSRPSWVPRFPASLILACFKRSCCSCLSRSSCSCRSRSCHSSLSSSCCSCLSRSSCPSLFRSSCSCRSYSCCPCRSRSCCSCLSHYSCSCHSRSSLPCLCHSCSNLSSLSWFNRAWVRRSCSNVSWSKACCSGMDCIIGKSCLPPTDVDVSSVSSSL